MIRPATILYNKAEFAEYTEYSYHNLYELYIRVVTGIMTDLGIQAWKNCRDEDAKTLLQDCLRGIYDKDKTNFAGKSTADLLMELDEEYGEALPANFRKKGWTIKEAGRQGAPAEYRSHWYSGSNLIVPGSMNYGSGTLRKQTRTLSWGKYALQCMQIYYCLKRIGNYDRILNIMGRSVYIIALLTAMRNVLYGHSTQVKTYYSLLRDLSIYLMDTDDPVLGKSYKIAVPFREKGTGILCLKDNDSNSQSVTLDKEYLTRPHILEEASGSELENTALREEDIFSSTYLFVDDWGLLALGFSDYIRISPYFGTDSKKMCRELSLSSGGSYGLLMNVNLQNEYHMMSIMDASDQLINEKEDTEFTFEIRADSELSAVAAKAPEFYGNYDIRINKSRHPEFVEARMPERDFIYLDTIPKTDSDLLEKFQNEKDYHFFIYIHGHGGLGKTHIVLNMLRDRYLIKKRESGSNKKKQKGKMEGPFFRQIIFLSAKKKIMSTDKRMELTLDKDKFDIESYKDVLCALYSEMLQTGESDEKIRSMSEDSLEKTLAEHVEGRKDPVLIVIDDLDTLDKKDEEKICQYLGNIQQPRCRIIITSRYFFEDYIRGFPVTTISLKPLTEEESWNFLQKYVAKKMKNERDAKAALRGFNESWYSEGEKSKKAHLQEMTGGVPLKLVLIAGMLLHGYDANSVWKEAWGLMTDTDTFMYRNLLDNVSDDAKYIMGTLGCINRILDPDQTNNLFREIGTTTLRLFLPEMEDDSFNNGISELVDVSVFISISGTAPSEGDKVLFRSPELAWRQEIREISLPESTEELVKQMEKDPNTWRQFMSYTGTMLDAILDICRNWRQLKKLSWVSRMTAIVLKRQKNGFLGQGYKNWQILKRCTDIELSISTLDDYGFNKSSTQWEDILQNLQEMSGYLDSEKKLICTAYNHCLKCADECEDRARSLAQEIDKAAANGKGTTDRIADMEREREDYRFLCNKIRKSTVRNYYSFCENAGRDFLDRELDDNIEKAARFLY